MPLTIAILAGGKSSRFGQDKAALFLPKIIEACVPTGFPLLVIGRAGQDNIDGTIEFLEDDLPDQGPLGGIITVLRRASSPVLVLACDLAFLETDAVVWLIQHWEEAEDAAILVAAHDSLERGRQLEPLFAIYSPTCLPVAERLLQEGRRSLHKLLDSCKTEVVPLPESLVCQIRNINAPTDLA